MDQPTPSEAPEGRGLLISHLHDQFWSDEYYRAARAVRAWKAAHGPDWAGDLFRRLDEAGGEGADDADEADEALRVNAGRRLIKSYFRKAQQLCARGLLEEADLREQLTMAQRLGTLFEIIEPFEVARQEDYNREMFDFYDRLHGLQLERPCR